jgi:hypothetical protein
MFGTLVAYGVRSGMMMLDCKQIITRGNDQMNGYFLAVYARSHGLFSQLGSDALRATLT